MPIALGLAVAALGFSPRAQAAPWDKKVKPPPEKAELVLTHPEPPDPMPEGSIMVVPVERELPENWRSTDKATTKGRANGGFQELRASGSGQFCPNQLYEMREALQGRLVKVVDLRQEPHCFLDGAAVSWGPPDVVGNNRTAAQVEAVEKAWFQHVVAGKFVNVTRYASGTFADTKTWWEMKLRLDIREASLEEALLTQEARWGYFRIAAPDSVTPRDEDVDRLVTFVRRLEPGTWLHFHCDTGGNRTTMFLTMYDMMRNFDRVAREDIIARQRKLGGVNLLTGPDKAARDEFLDRFYSYCWQSGPTFLQSWTAWNRRGGNQRN